jgi:NAD(P)-dependent dehydrogenase (short-subunit alcohol dehydrogenase family)
MTDVQGPAELFGLAGRTAVVTGASSGLGARAARVLATAGATVYAAARRRDRLDDLVGDGLDIRPVTCDVADADSRHALIEAAGTVDILVNNAGMLGDTDAFAEDVKLFSQVLDVNLVAPFHLAVLVAERAERGASIINIASILGMVSVAPNGGAAYSASKSGLLGLTRELAGQFAPRSVRVNAIAPGWIRTEMTGDLFDHERGPGWISRNTMLKRPGDIGELDGALLYLASQASSYCTGQTLVVDGGWTAR